MSTNKFSFNPCHVGSTFNISLVFWDNEKKSQFDYQFTTQCSNSGAAKSHYVINVIFLFLWNQWGNMQTYLCNRCTAEPKSSSKPVISTICAADERLLFPVDTENLTSKQERKSILPYWQAHACSLHLVSQTTVLVHSASCIKAENLL